MSTTTQLARFRSQHHLWQQPGSAPKTNLRELWSDGVATAAILTLCWILAYEFMGLMIW